MTPASKQASKQAQNYENCSTDVKFFVSLNSSNYVLPSPLLVKI
jgi:hypothetical protein